MISTTWFMGGAGLLFATLASLVWQIHRVRRERAARRITESELRKVRDDWKAEEVRLEALLRLNRMEKAELAEITDFALEAAVQQTGSQLGYLAFLNEDETVLNMHAWSAGAMQQCEVKNRIIEYPVASTGLWGEAVRQRKPIITNDYAAPHPHKRGLPEGHVPIRRHMNVPVFDGDRIAVVAGVGNKATPYTDSDIRQVSLVMQGMWQLLVNRRSMEQLKEAHAELENRVRERTSAVVAANERFQAEVAERRNAEALLQQEMERARSYLNVVGVIIRALDREGIVTLINRAACTLLDYREEEILGHSWSQLCVPEEHQALFQQRLDLAFNTSTMAFSGLEKTQSPLRTRSGEILMIQWHNSLITDEDGNVTGVLSSGEDVTEQMRALDALRTSEERYRSVVDNIGVGVTVVSPRMEILAMNKQMREWNPDLDISTKPLCHESFNRPPLPDICSWCPTHLTLKDGQTHESVTNTRVGEETHNYRIIASPIHGLNGEIIAAIEVVQDVTERMRAEAEQMRYVHDLEQLWNEQARLSGELSNSLEELEASKLETEAALKKLQQAQTSMVQSEKMASIGVLAAGVAHEINNPIGFVTSNLHELNNYTGKIRGYLKEVKKLELEIAAGNIENVQKAHRDLETLWRTLKLDFVLDDLTDLVKESLEGASSIETIVKALKTYAHQDEQTVAALDLHAIIDNTLRVVWNQLKYKAEIRREYGEIPLVRGSYGPLQQVFSNLLVNAAQAIATQGEIRIRTWSSEGRVSVAISDNGCGISAENLPRIFEPFFSTKDVGQGTGLGLSIAYDIIKKFHGSISAESKPGRGTTFTVQLPAEAVDKSVEKADSL